MKLVTAFAASLALVSIAYAGAAAAQQPQQEPLIFDSDDMRPVWGENTWAAIPAKQAVQKLMKSYIEYPPRPVQSETYTGPITLTAYQRFKHIRDELEKEGFDLPMPTGS